MYLQSLTCRKDQVNDEGHAGDAAEYAGRKLRSIILGAYGEQLN